MGTGPDSTSLGSRAALTSVIVNRSPDSAIVVLEDAGGAVMRSQTIPATDSVCWTTAPSDSVWYNVGIWMHSVLYFPFAHGSLNGVWITHTALLQTHEFVVLMSITSGGIPAASVNPIGPGGSC